MIEFISALGEGNQEDRVWNVSWDWKGEILASCGSDKNIHLWKRKSRTRRLDCGDYDEGNKTSMQASEEESGDHDSNRSSCSSWECISVLGDGHTKTVRSCCFSPCGRYIASTSFDATTIIWEKSEGTWEMLQTLEGHENEVKCACWSPSGQYLATCSRDKSVWIWEIDEEEDFQCCSILQNHTQDVKCVKWHPKMDIWQRFPLDCPPEKGKWECVSTIAGGYHDGPIYSVDWMTSSDKAVSDSQDSFSLDLIQTVHSAHKEDVNCVRWNRTVAGLLASASDDGYVKLWHLENWD